MKKQTWYLIIIGGLLIGINLFTRHFFAENTAILDFIVGLGVAFIISALFCSAKAHKK